MSKAALTAAAAAFVADTTAATARAAQVLRDNGTLSASRTLSFFVRIPDEKAIVALRHPSPFAATADFTVTVVGFDGAILSGAPSSGVGRYLPLFLAHADITTVAHVHTPYLGAWSQSHRALPIRYVPVQRHTLSREIPIYVDRTQPEPAFIRKKLEQEPHIQAVLEANGGATTWGKGTVLQLAQQILFLEEGARFQLLAESLGGAKDYGPGVLEKQWRRGGLLPAAE